MIPVLLVVLSVTVKMLNGVCHNVLTVNCRACTVVWWVISIGVGTQSTLGGHNIFFAGKYVWKINKVPEFYVILAWKISKIREFL